MGDDPTLMLNAPVPAARKVLDKAGLTIDDIDLFEVNEAFAVVAEKFIRDLDLDRDKVNVNGGAMALGHPIGATGAILIGTVLDELERTRRPARPRHHVRRRRHGPGDHHRTDLSMSDEQAVLYEVTDEAVGVVTLNRPDKANSQTPAMLDELNDVLMGAAADRAVKVIVLQANGKHFSAGHDISGEGRREEDAIDLKVEGLAGIYEWETKRYIGYSRAWRDIRKPTIAAVQGQCIAGGLLLCWPMDIIIAADNAKFSDPVVRMGIGGVEYHGHTWELGPRKAKEWLFTASQFTAAEAEKFGMVNHVVPLDELREFTMAMAGRIAGMNAFALAQAKRAVNQTQDVQGFYAAIQSVFDIHSTGHGHALSVNGYPILVDLDQMKQSMKEG